MPVRAADLAEVWADIADTRIVEAQAAFKAAAPADPRERALAGALFVLARPPLTEAGIATVATTCTELARGDDELAALALYLSARVVQVHRLSPDYPQAASLYRELARRHPQSHWAQLGLVKLGLLTLHALPEPADAAARVAAAGTLLTGITEPALQRDLHLQIGAAAVLSGLPVDTALPHLIAADKVGGLLGLVGEDLVIQIGELSLRAGHREQGIAYLQRFLRDFPTNTRRYNIEQRLAEVGASRAPEGAP
jgi:hypothetical protein